MNGTPGGARKWRRAVTTLTGNGDGAAAGWDFLQSANALSPAQNRNDGESSSEDTPPNGL